jgi:uncharacterized NAD(P)/FAD-binding protein YdhS
MGSPWASSNRSVTETRLTPKPPLPRIARMDKYTVAIVGGGFCGTVAAIRLLGSSQRGGPSLPFGSKVVLIEPGRAGEGLAYRAGPDYWRLNVPAKRMSAFPERPDDFLAWAQARNPLLTGDDFLPRAWYGDYLAERLDLARRRSPRWLAFEQIRSRATAIDVATGSARIALSNGDVIEADRVLLALGNSAAAAPLVEAPGAVNDAWNLNWTDRLPTYVPRVLLVGTSLTMIDQVLAIMDRRPDTRMMAISRHGLLPLPHEDELPVEAPIFDSAALLARGPLSRRLRFFRAQVAASDGNWRATVQQLRRMMPELWQAAPRTLRRRFLRHLRSYWDVHRHRAPRAASNEIERLCQRRRLEVAAGRIVGMRDIRRGIVVTWQPRGSDRLREELVDAVVNVTGPDPSPHRSACPLVQTLVKQGLCTSDELGLGWDTDPDGRLVDANGNASDVLFYAGPLLRAGHFEATAVPELGAHVQRTAATIAASLATNAGSCLRKIAAPMFRRAQATF